MADRVTSGNPQPSRACRRERWYAQVVLGYCVAFATSSGTGRAYHAVVRWQRENGYELQPTDRPVWDPVTIEVAEAIRQGKAVARVTLPMPLSVMIPESPLYP